MYTNTKQRRFFRFSFCLAFFFYFFPLFAEWVLFSLIQLGLMYMFDTLRYALDWYVSLMPQNNQIDKTYKLRMGMRTPEYARAML